MIIEYVQRAMERARYDKLEDGRFYGEIPPCRGVWATGRTLESCRVSLQEVLEEWILLKVRDGNPLPVINGRQIRLTRKGAHG